MMFGQNSRKHVEIGGYKLNPGLRGKCTLQNPGLAAHTHTQTETGMEGETMKVERAAADQQGCVGGKTNKVQ